MDCLLFRWPTSQSQQQYLRQPAGKLRKYWGLTLTLGCHPVLTQDLLALTSNSKQAERTCAPMPRHKALDPRPMKAFLAMTSNLRDTSLHRLQAINGQLVLTRSSRDLAEEKALRQISGLTVPLLRRLWSTLTSSSRTWISISLWRMKGTKRPVIVPSRSTREGYHRRIPLTTYVLRREMSDLHQITRILTSSEATRAPSRETTNIRLLLNEAFARAVVWAAQRVFVMWSRGHTSLKAAINTIPLLPSVLAEQVEQVRCRTH